jgi:cell wall-associated NlpC family hydrolase
MDQKGGALPFGARLAPGDPRGVEGPLGPVRLARARAGTVRLAAGGRGAKRGQRVVSAARRFLGASYHWGGRTFAGLDCSGLIQLAARREGILLPRDAREQCGAVGGGGRLRPFAPGFPGPRAGDLWFFGPSAEKVTHVALSTGDLGLIHAYGSVQWGSLDPLSAVFEPELFRFVLGWQSLPNK